MISYSGTMNQSDNFINGNCSMNISSACALPWREHLSAEVVFAVIIMFIINVAAVINNIGVVTVLLYTPQLRNQVTYVFVLNLCFTDLLSSFTVLPVSIVAFAIKSWPLGQHVCNMAGFITSLSMFVSIFTICAISIERYYSIKWPMHYSVHMTSQRAVGIVIGLWLLAILFAVFPLFGWNAYDFHSGKAHCTFSRTGDVNYIITIGVICFVLPTLITLCMYYGIYRIAKKTASQIHPERIRANPSSSEPRQVPHIVEQDSVCSSKEVVVVNTDLKEDENKAAFNHSPIHWKAVRTLFVIITLFMALWGPYFIILFYTASNGHIQSDQVHIFTVWLGFFSYAANPLVYSLLNRTVRDAIVTMYGRWKAALCIANVTEVTENHNAENGDFFQFLERTSAPKRNTISENENQSLAVTSVM